MARVLTNLTMLALVTFGLVVLAPTASADTAATTGSSCGATINPIACENSKPGTPSSVWDINGAGDSSLQGFSTNISANVGSTLNFKVDASAAYTMDIYRLGYYGGSGARLIQANLSHSAPVSQPTCLSDPSTGLVDCGNWSVSASWAIPSAAVSGVYIAKLTHANGSASHITFVVRNDASTSAINYQTSDETWQAYNRYGGADFYTGSQFNLFDSTSRARKLSYNRPFATRDDNSGRDFLFSNEYPTIRYLEQNGYDVSYVSGVDTDRYGATLLKNHKIFLSVGHDEYWSQQQRTNVENARDAGVSLMFLSGNEVYWHTRFEPSIDGSNTAYRTLVCYKTTWDNADTDPSGESTGTFRDPRFSAAPGGSSPENSLTGTQYMANSDDLAITVTQAQGKSRLWRGTGLSAMTTATTALAPHTVGYESDEDLDNGFRPAGLVDLSTTVGATPQYLQDFGTDVAAGTTTHHLTLYKAASGALVFGAGTIQWAWGLDVDHDGDTSGGSDARMRQATANMLSDMGANPTTLASGMVNPAATADTVAPTSKISSPTASQAIANGTQLKVTGTASDTGGGVVAGVEVSLDGGSTWHPAIGTNSWSYTGVVAGYGSTKVEARATDDSANTQSAPTIVSAATSCPCSLFGAKVPTKPDSGDASPNELGIRFTPSVNGYVSGIRFYKSAGNTGTHTGTLWSATGTQLATGTFTSETASGWQTLKFAQPVSVTAGTTYVGSYFAPKGHYAADPLFFYYRDFKAYPLSAQAMSPTDASAANGVFADDAHAFPSSTFKGANYYADVLFTDAGSSRPSVTSVSPAANATGVRTSSTVSASFGTDMQSSTVGLTLTSSAGSVAGTLAYTAANRTVTFTPSAALAGGLTYTATVTGSDLAGNSLTPVSWTFSTTGACPCSLFASATPGTIDAGDAGAVNLGVKFTPASNGYVTGIRFYKSTANIGTHTGTLWSSTGTQLATGTFTGETATGWQTLTFTQPVAVTAATTYVASYLAPKGHYSFDANYFATIYTNGPLSAPAGTNGLYAYNTATAFPTGSYNSSNYWIDATYTTVAPADTTPPTVVATTPSAGATGMPSGQSATAVFSEDMQSSTVGLTLTSSAGSVAGTLAYTAANRTVTFTPSAALAGGLTYTATVTGSDLAGNSLTPVSWTFSTTGACPCSLFASATPGTIDAGDAGAVNLGVKFTPASNGYVTGIRFYKSTANIGTHTGTLWSSTGTQLATGTFTGETATGWQTLTFTQPVAVTAATTYVASYLAPKGHYSFDANYFATTYTNGPLSAPAGTNGLYAYNTATAFPTGSYNSSNYWIDATYTAG